MPKDTEQDLVLEPAAHWEHILEPKLKNALLKKKRPLASDDTVTCKTGFTFTADTKVLLCYIDRDSCMFVQPHKTPLLYLNSRVEAAADERGRSLDHYGSASGDNSGGSPGERAYYPLSWKWTASFSGTL